jgi:mono/diheme cytochrome c family protein
MNWHDFSSKQVLGTVPLEKDGSAYVEVPSERFVFFQVLDREGRMIQSMRSGTVLQPGETQGCIGCHESRSAQAPPADRHLPMAVVKPPQALEGWLGPPRDFSYRQEVQPVFDQHCVTCHDFGKQGGERLLLAGDLTPAFNVSYQELWHKKIITAVGGGPAEVQPARSWGASASRLIQVLDQGHHDVALSDEDWDRLTTWIDLNAPYYAHYESAYPDHPAGRSPMTFEEHARLSELTGVDVHSQGFFAWSRPLSVLISFTRPELSPCLAGLEPTTDAYREAVGLIRAGAARLEQRPRADMPGFVPAAYAEPVEARYARLRERESRVREALETGERVYDHPADARAADSP